MNKNYRVAYGDEARNDLKNLIILKEIRLIKLSEKSQEILSRKMRAALESRWAITRHKLNWVL